MVYTMYTKKRKTLKEIIVKACGGPSKTIPGHGTGNLYILCKF